MLPPMSFTTIALVVFLKGVLFALLHKLGWFAKLEARAVQADEERLVLRAYREWRKNGGPGPAQPVRVARKGFANINR